MKSLSSLVACLLVGCAAKPPGPQWSPDNLPPIRITTKSELILFCDPSDAEVSLDGVPQGTCDDFRGDPKGLFLGKGVRKVQVKKVGFFPWDTILETDGTRVVMNVTLISKSGAVAPGGMR